MYEKVVKGDGVCSKDPCTAHAFRKSPMIAIGIRRLPSRHEIFESAFSTFTKHSSL